MSSTSGLHGNVGQANYAAAKMGIVGLTKTVAKEWGPLVIRANAVAFGMIDTRMTNAFGEGETVSVGGKDVARGLPEHVAKMWQSDELLRATVPLCRKGEHRRGRGRHSLPREPTRILRDRAYPRGHGRHGYLTIQNSNPRNPRRAGDFGMI